MWPRRDLLELLKIEYPIVQAPMAGSDSPALAAAVSNAGGLGSLGLGAKSTAVARHMIDELRASTNRPFNINFFAHRAPRYDEAQAAQTLARMAPFYEEMGVDTQPDARTPPYHPFDADKLDLMLELKPAAVSFHFGVPDGDAVSRLRQVGCLVMASATCVSEARALAEVGVDVVIAQGWEAGGHRSSFEANAPECGVGTLALVPQIVDAVEQPVIAAGGIADGRGIAAAFALGASGVQLGTAFLWCPESAIRDRHRANLRRATDDDTLPTRAYSGRSARGRRNAYIDAFVAQRGPLPEFPLMSRYSSLLSAASPATLEEGDERQDLRFYLYGQAAALGRDVPAAELVGMLVEETRSVFGALGQ